MCVCCACARGWRRRGRKRERERRARRRRGVRSHGGEGGSWGASGAPGFLRPRTPTPMAQLFWLAIPAGGGAVRAVRPLLKRRAVSAQGGAIDGRAQTPMRGAGAGARPQPHSSLQPAGLPRPGTCGGIEPPHGRVPGRVGGGRGRPKPGRAGGERRRRRPADPLSLARASGPVGAPHTAPPLPDRGRTYQSAPWRVVAAAAQPRPGRARREGEREAGSNSDGGRLPAPAFPCALASRTRQKKN